MELYQKELAWALMDFIGYYYSLLRILMWKREDASFGHFISSAFFISIVTVAIKSVGTARSFHFTLVT